jgi:agmatine deiminase
MCTELEYDLTKIDGIGPRYQEFFKNIEYNTIQDLQLKGTPKVVNAKAKEIREKLEEMKAKSFPESTGLPSVATLSDFIEFANSPKWKFKDTKERYINIITRTLINSYYNYSYYKYKKYPNNLSNLTFIEFLKEFNSPSENQFRKNLLEMFHHDWYDKENYEELIGTIGKKNQLKLSDNIKMDYEKYFIKEVLNWDDFIIKYGDDYNNRKCEYCGISEMQITNLLEKEMIFTKRIISRGESIEIDQGDPNGGYNDENIKLACYWCNNAKTDEFVEEEFEPIGETIRKAWNKRIDKVNRKEGCIIIEKIPPKKKRSKIMKLIPDWHKPRSLVLVWPEKLHNRNHLIRFYKEFIRLLPSGLELTLILKNKEIEKLISAELQHINSGITIQYHVIPIVEDIWIRDWAPFIGVNVDGNKAVAKMIYDPPYFKEKHREYAKKDNEAGSEIAEYFKYKILEYPAIWDGGNLTHNGNNYGIFTEGLLDDKYMRDENIWSVIGKVQLEEYVAVENEPGDITGHTDGFIRFIDEKTLMIAAYPDEYYKGEQLISTDELTESREFMDSLAEQYADEFNIIRVTNSIPSSKITEGMPSAVGNYINFLRLGDKVLIPQYGIREDEAAYDEFTKFFGKANVIKISKDISKLADLGGVLNCFSWVAY